MTTALRTEADLLRTLQTGTYTVGELTAAQYDQIMAALVKAGRPRDTDSIG